MKTLAAIPCHNEGLTIGSVVLKARKYVDLVLVIDDGSADDTVDVAESAGAVVVSHGVNKGKGRAVRTSPGYAAEHGFEVLVLLADMLKMCGRIWMGCYIGWGMESSDERRE